MIAIADDIRKALRQLWPNVGLLWLPDGTYERPPVDKVVALLQTSGVASLERRGEVFDCDDYALCANAFIKRKSLEYVLDHPWAFGEAFCSKLRGHEMSHTLNILYANDGIWLIEPQGYFYRMADKELDNVETVKM